MPGSSVEERLTAVEIELEELKQRLATEIGSKESPWWERHFGAFRTSSHFEDAIRLGRSIAIRSPRQQTTTMYLLDASQSGRSVRSRIRRACSRSYESMSPARW